MVGTPVSFAFFSTLHARSSIAPHAAPCNLRLRVHLPLEPTPAQSLGAGVDECGMRVGAERVAWETGKPVLFDDSYEHEVIHAGSEDRFVVLCILHHPYDDRAAGEGPGK